MSRLAGCQRVSKLPQAKIFRVFAFQPNLKPKNLSST
jgi:hypothetical protein